MRVLHLAAYLAAVTVLRLWETIDRLLMRPTVMRVWPEVIGEEDEMESFCEPGGQEYDESSFKKQSLRADLCNIACGIDHRYGARIVDAILERYNVKRKVNSFKEKEPVLKEPRGASEL